MSSFSSFHVQIEDTVMIPDGGITTVGKRAGAPVAYARSVVGIPAKYPCRNLSHEAAVVVPDAVPYHVVAHFGSRYSAGLLLCLAACGAAAEFLGISPLLIASAGSAPVTRRSGPRATVPE